jgi:thiol-disulfide isomerase/thioredoxin
VVVNLWARSCPPCLAELPELAQLVADWKQKDKAGVQFLFIADPPEQTSAAEVASFWTAPLVDELAGRCPGTRMPHGSRASCLVSVPDLDPLRADSDSLTRAVGSETRPLTLLLDEQGTVRQVFAGALAGRGAQLNGAIERLLAAVRGRAVLSARRSAL